MDPSDLPLRLREHPYAVGIQALCAHYWDAIRTKKVFGRRYLQYYQKLLIQEQLPSFKTLTREFFQELDTAFKMNVSLGLILLNNETQELSFFSSELGRYIHPFKPCYSQKLQRLAARL